MKQFERHVCLFRNGRSHALRIPQGFELEGDESIVRKVGHRPTVKAVRKEKLLALLSALPPINEPFSNVDEGLTRLF